MADQNVSLVYVDLFTFYQSVDRIIVRKIISILICTSDQLHHGRLHKGKQIKIHRPIFILEYHFLNMIFFCLRRYSDHINFLTVKHTPKTVHTRCTVVISTDHHNYRIRNCISQLSDKMIKHLHCFCRRNCFVIDVPCDHDRIRHFLCGLLNYLIQYIFLIFSEISIN